MAYFVSFLRNTQLFPIQMNPLYRASARLRGIPEVVFNIHCEFFIMWICAFFRPYNDIVEVD